MSADITAFAPGRVNLIGEHTDYNRGLALPFAVREGVTVHAKLVLVDDVFANIGSANMFSRSMYGTDSEMSAAVVTSSDVVRELRIAVWGEHLRTELTEKVRESLADLDLALGIWRPQWLPAGVSHETWQRSGSPVGFAPAERAITLVGPHI